MKRTTKRQRDAAARARQGRAEIRQALAEAEVKSSNESHADQLNDGPEQPDIDSDKEDPTECTTWEGGLECNCEECILGWEDDDLEFDDEDEDLDLLDVDENSEDGGTVLNGEVILEVLREKCAELAVETEPETSEEIDSTSWGTIFGATKTKQDWEKAESNRALGYNGQATRTRQERDKKARSKAAKDAVMRTTAQASNFRSFFSLKPTPTTSEPSLDSESLETSPPTPVPNSDDKTPSPKTPALPTLPLTHVNPMAEFDSEHICFGYLSDESMVSTESSNADSNYESRTTAEAQMPQPPSPESLSPDISQNRTSGTGMSLRPVPLDHGVHPPPPKRRRLLEVPARVAKAKAQKKRLDDRMRALRDIDKLILSKRDVFDAGKNGLQASRARAIRACLHMVTKNHRNLIEASERAAESEQLATSWGGRCVRRWTATWILSRTLPSSQRGCHKKVFSLLDDPAICTELRSFLRSHKWSMNPSKLADLTKNKLMPAEAQKYLHHVVSVEMPRGLQKYLEVSLFPRIQVKVARGVSIRTAQRWLNKEGFKFTSHKKALFYDGHEREDVVHYRQKEFIPLMKQYSRRLVSFSADDPNIEIQPDLEPGERKLVLVAHDEMTAQSNDGQKMSWVFKGEQPLKKKGVGRGLHQSDVICSTVGWLSEASQTLEYGKNYDGYWTGVQFAAQLKERIIPAFEKAHPPSQYQALIMVDNSQGHSAYSEDALLTSRMNLKPGGKQARLRNGWFIKDGQRVEQEMIFPPTHPTNPNQAKGMRQVLIERGLWREGLVMCCKNRKVKAKGKDGQAENVNDDVDDSESAPRCNVDATDCCAKRILDLQPDFKAQKSLIQETIESLGHLCIFLPKFHCELNFIEYFWGATKRYLREHCDYTFPTLQENMPKALASVPILTIRKWENRTKRWISAYERGLSVQDAQLEVMKTGSRRGQYASHQKVSSRDD